MTVLYCVGVTHETFFLVGEKEKPVKHEWMTGGWMTGGWMTGEWMTGGWMTGEWMTGGWKETLASSSLTYTSQ